MRLIKRYKNRRLYDTETKQMVTISDLSEAVKNDEEFQVIDNVSGKDITGEILTTILKSEVSSWKDLTESGKLIRELISKKGTDAANALRKGFLASMGLISLDRKRAEEIVDELIKKGELAGSKRKETIKSMMDKADSQSKKVYEQSKEVFDKAGEESRRIMSKAQEQINAGLERLRRENKDEIAELNSKISSLESAIKRMEDKLDNTFNKNP
ncbi:MAG: hypothetical protein GF307_13275 [candidate division Zixibacteria bacterium]|nr:hypothetical protein [candidate division Zixibacteria bacterium]